MSYSAMHVLKLLNVWVGQTVRHPFLMPWVCIKNILHLYSIISNESGPSKQREQQLSEDSTSQQLPRKRLKRIDGAAVVRRKLQFPAAAANSPSVTVSYKYTLHLDSFHMQVMSLLFITHRWLLVIQGNLSITNWHVFEKAWSIHWTWESQINCKWSCE